MTVKLTFGRPMRDSQFGFSPTFTPLNHGSFGAYPRAIQEAQDAFQKQCHKRPDTFIVYDLPVLIDESRKSVAPLLGVDVNEVVFVPNATTGINTVLRNLKWEAGDVVVYFSTIYGACEKTLSSVKEHEPLQTTCIELQYPVSDAEIVRLLREEIARVRAEGKNVRLAMFDTVLTFPGVRMPWEEMVEVCREMDVLSLIDGAHGIGHVDLKHLGRVEPDFFVSNCHKWLYTPRSCAVFHVPFRNQHLIRTCIPTSHGFQPLDSKPDIPDDKPPFVYLFQFVATFDYTPYLCVPAALEFRKMICGGEEAIQNYCYEVARLGGAKTAEILGTEVMGAGFEGSQMKECSFANVRLPLNFKSSEEGGQEDKRFREEDAGNIGKWINMTAVKEFDTYLQIALHAGSMWVRLSGQIYLEVGNFEWVGYRLKELCARVKKGEVRYMDDTWQGWSGRRGFDVLAGQGEDSIYRN